MLRCHLSCVLLACALAACTPGYPFSIVRQATPIPYASARQYAIADVTWEGFLMERKTEAQWLAGRTTDQRASWAKDKVLFNQNVLEGFRSRARKDERFTRDSGGFVIAANIDGYDDGLFAWHVQIRDRAGNVIDEIRGTPQGGTWYGLWGDLRAFPASIPRDVLKYLRRRYQ